MPHDLWNQGDTYYHIHGFWKPMWNQNVGPDASQICGNQIKVVNGYRLPRGLHISISFLLPHEPWDYLSVVLPGASPAGDVLGENHHEHPFRSPSFCSCIRNVAGMTFWILQDFSEGLKWHSPTIKEKKKGWVSEEQEITYFYKLDLSVSFKYVQTYFE